jgi:hypothetical protein
MFKSLDPRLGDLLTVLKVCDGLRLSEVEWRSDGKSAYRTTQSQRSLEARFHFVTRLKSWTSDSPISAANKIVGLLKKCSGNSGLTAILASNTTKPIRITPPHTSIAMILWEFQVCTGGAQLRQ